MAVKIQKPDYWPALIEGERLAGIQREQDAKRRSIINKDDCIRIRGANEHNLKNLTLEIPRNELVVLTGLSGSGKSSLAFDTIYAEGQRRYMESLSSYARQFLGQMEKPDVEKIEGLSPAISIDQKSTNRNPRSTVGTVTEIYDYFRLLYARIGIPHCPNCGREIARQTVDQMVDRIMELPEKTRIQILAPVVRGRKGEHQKVFDRARRAGYVRLRVDGNLYDGRHTEKAHGLGGERAAAGGRPSAGGCGGRGDDAVLPELCLPGLRDQCAGDRAQELLLQQPLRRLPCLRRPWLPHGVRAGTDHSG